ncbi:hypothetical protein TanjilG_16152 [Lupinus angustifolius]|uniref:Nudix hydrolase domain-containing protein n=1 Tax=Lupinus angustifolius TaxID=3871 RepID=A0A1J7GWN5_LUPAN|nr:PREDICTED: isopentenyl-diphosphate Delta-isomerase I-like [Lupinus angustifolius]OIW04796.1 hypothetical protein TanjilG_16152 [Lupinus angustifolius]
MENGHANSATLSKTVANLKLNPKIGLYLVRARLDYLLFIVRDVNVTPNPDEVADVKYVNRDQLKELLEKADAGDEGLKLSPWFRLVVDNFLFKWWDHVEKGTLEKVADMKTIHRLT